jgi:hypothetical protein
MTFSDCGKEDSFELYVWSDPELIYSQQAHVSQKTQREGNEEKDGQQFLLQKS